MTMDQDFPQKVTHGRHFFSPPLSGALRRTTQEWAKLPMAKEKPGVKIEKKYNMC